LREGERESAPTTLLLRLGLSIFLTLNVMIASWLSYSQELLGGGGATPGESDFVQLAAFLALFLCTLVLVMLGLPLTVDSARALLATGRLDAQLLIAIGVLSAYALSVANTVRGAGSLYFDTAAGVLVVVALGNHLEAGAKRRAGNAASRLLVAMPRRVRVLRDGGEIEARPTDVEIGEIVVVRPGDVVAVDGRIQEGLSSVDESTLTGESSPRFVQRGDPVLAGSQNHDGRLLVAVERGAGETVLALMESSLAMARQARPPAQRLADRVAAVFVPGVVLLALALFAVHAARGEPSTGLLRAMSVLLISCPCALGLAAPLASWQGLRRAAERGILVDCAATLERAALVRHVVFDKTGTLTRPEPALERVVTAAGVTRQEALVAAASLEAVSSHPIARAVGASARALGVEVEAVTEGRQVAGRGVEAKLGGRLLRLGSRRWATSLGLETVLEAEAPHPAELHREKNGLYLMDRKRVLARLELGESDRADAAVAIADLRRQGISGSVLSGDAVGPTERLARRLDLPATAGLLPGEKVERLQALRAERGGVAMVGDGVNDAPVLAAADVGIAVGSAADLARRSGHVRLVGDRLIGVPRLTAIARDVRRRIRANLLFAFGFNTIGIGLAAAGLLTPIFAALAMIASSLAVIRISSAAGRVALGTDAPHGRAGTTRERAAVEVGA
jgi:heavy metal translocating P-type ATPase